MQIPWIFICYAQGAQEASKATPLVNLLLLKEGVQIVRSASSPRQVFAEARFLNVSGLLGRILKGGCERPQARTFP